MRATAIAFVAALEQALDVLSEHPALGSARFADETGIPDLRSLALGRFPSIAFYTDDGDAVHVHRVLHTRGDLPDVVGSDG